MEKLVTSQQIDIVLKRLVSLGKTLAIALSKKRAAVCVASV